jgi:ATP synthase F1 gamma subunit
MRTKNDIKDQARQLDTLEGLTHAYAEIASRRMKASRERVVQNRSFIEATNSIFDEVRFSYAVELKKLLSGQNKGGKVTLLGHNGKTVCIFLSANTGLYGDIVGRTFDMMLEEVREKDTEVTILGKLGLNLFLQAEPKRPYTFFDLPDSGVKAEDLAEIIKHIVKYQEIHIYHGKFQSVVSQKPVVYNISSDLPFMRVVNDKNHDKYIFEPSLEEVLVFFESEIFASLFDQSVRENELSKFASRMFAMDSANQNIRDELKKLNLEKLRLQHTQNNKKQQGMMIASYLIR